MGGKNVDFYYVDLTKINFLRKINLLYHHSWFRSVIEDLSTFDKDGVSSVERNKVTKLAEMFQKYFKFMIIIRFHSLFNKFPALLRRNN